MLIVSCWTDLQSLVGCSVWMGASPPRAFTILCGMLLWAILGLPNCSHTTAGGSGRRPFLLLAPTHSASCCHLGFGQKHYLEPSLLLTDCIWHYYSWLPGSPVNRPTPQLATPQASAHQAATVADPPLDDLGDLPAVCPPPFVEAGASSPTQLRGKRGLD